MQDPRLAPHFEALTKEHGELNDSYKALNERTKAFDDSRVQLRRAIMAVIMELGSYLFAVIKMSVQKHK